MKYIEIILIIFKEVR